MGNMTPAYKIKLLRLAKELKNACDTTNRDLENEKWAYFMGFLEALQEPTYQIRKWSRKGQCPVCRVQTGSYHSVYCKWHEENKKYSRRTNIK